MAPLRSLSVVLLRSWASCVSCESCVSCCLSAPFASMPYLAHLAHGGHLRFHEGLVGVLECWCLQCRGFNLNGPPWEKRQRRRQDVRGKFSQIGCGSRHDTSTRVWGATQRLRSTNWATPLEGVGGSCTFQRVGLSLPPLHWRPFSGSQRGKSHPSILPACLPSYHPASCHQTLKAHISARPSARLTFDPLPIASGSRRHLWTNPLAQ
ncbi:hypothetical protein F5144DRAFT_139004 [Chaetomium tenue]|uniref:Uncharacterized protein n=1 Tax=Chaetomium tenue TaxID=1854479 RepID=A0ACB7PIF6_9PEZI|nr:hypothetical protein F5144DRAFT_139004 [Chaetomium globosum]